MRATLAWNDEAERPAGMHDEAKDAKVGGGLLYGLCWPRHSSVVLDEVL